MGGHTLAEGGIHLLSVFHAPARLGQSVYVLSPFLRVLPLELGVSSVHGSTLFSDLSTSLPLRFRQTQPNPSYSTYSV